MRLRFSGVRIRTRPKFLFLAISVARVVVFFLFCLFACLFFLSAPSFSLARFCDTRISSFL